MKKIIFAALALTLVSGCALADGKPTFNNLEEKISYIIGFQFGTDMSKDQINVSPEVFLKGMKDGLAGNQSALDEKQAAAAMDEFRVKMMAQQQAKMKEQAAENKKKGDAFRAEFKKKPGVKTLPSGVMYRVISAGKGPQPKPTDVVEAHYTGKLVDGTKFDSSEGRDKPVSFPLDGVIPGWSEALQQMNKGAKWEIVLPPEAAYGDRQVGPMIGPGSTLVFEVELVDFAAPKPEEAPAAAPQK